MRENLTKGISTLSASSLVNLASGASALGDIRQRHLEKKSKERQPDTDVEEKIDSEKRNELEKEQELEKEVEEKETE